MQLVGAGRGVIALVGPRRPDDTRWASNAATDALARASVRLGFGEDGDGWFAVVEALVAGCFPDLLSEAIEEQEDEYAKVQVG